MARDSENFLSSIYDAALSDEHWPRALSTLSRNISAVGAFIVAVDHVGLPFHIEQSSYPIEQLRFYFENYGHFDEQNFTILAKTTPMRLLRDCDVSSDVDRLEDRADYKWLKENIGARRKGAARLTQGKGWSDVIAFQFDVEWNPSTSAIQARLDELLPHFAKVIEINRKFSILRSQYHATLAALDHVRIGACVTGPHGDLVIANSEARRIFSLSDGLSLSRVGFLTLATPDLTNELTEKIRMVSLTARGEGSQHEVIFLASRKSSNRSFLIEIAPLRDSVGEIERGLTGTLIFIVDPENQGAICTKRLSVLCGLTETEGEICGLIVGGRSATEIARDRGVSEETVKSQFKTVYAKTGVRRRADLVRLAMTVDPPIG